MAPVRSELLVKERSLREVREVMEVGIAVVGELEVELEGEVEGESVEVKQLENESDSKCVRVAMEVGMVALGLQGMRLATGEM